MCWGGAASASFVLVAHRVERLPDRREQLRWRSSELKCCSSRAFEIHSSVRADQAKLLDLPVSGNKASRRLQRLRRRPVRPKKKRRRVPEILNRILT